MLMSSVYVAVVGRSHIHVAMNGQFSHGHGQHVARSFEFEASCCEGISRSLTRTKRSDPKRGPVFQFVAAAGRLLHDRVQNPWSPWRDPFSLALRRHSGHAKVLRLASKQQQQAVLTCGRSLKERPISMRSCDSQLHDADA